MEDIIVAIIAGLVILAFARGYLPRRKASPRSIRPETFIRHRGNIVNVVGVIYAAGVAAAILVPAELLIARSHRYIIILVAFILAIACGLIYARILGYRNRRRSAPHPGTK